MPKIILTGIASCHFIREIELPEDEAQELLEEDAELIACNLDHPDAAYSIDTWTFTAARRA